MPNAPTGTTGEAMFDEERRAEFCRLLAALDSEQTKQVLNLMNGLRDRRAPRAGH